ncbi:MULTISPECIES: hypothetical protein [unclassified Streptomyces]|uniref:hypothetical protein n=1 Tax=unclassified Streptomyces TaxID=2593676 RepID=UPI002B1CDD81|nr:MULTISPECIES: hypothetical protein [unclassified Streptomyces]
MPAGTAFAGGSLPLSVLITLVACLFTASCVAELARELPAAGSVSTYAARGLHPSALVSPSAILTALNMITTEQAMCASRNHAQLLSRLVPLDLYSCVDWVGSPPHTVWPDHHTLDPEANELTALLQGLTRPPAPVSRGVLVPRLPLADRKPGSAGLLQLRHASVQGLQTVSQARL